MTLLRYPTERCGRLLSPLSYLQDESLFRMDDETLGFAFICRPLTGGGDSTYKRLQVLLKQNWPVNTMVQFSLIGSENITPHIFNMRELRAGQTDPLLIESVEQRAQFLTAGVLNPIERRSQIRVRDIQLVISVKIRVGSADPSVQEVDRIRELRLSTEEGLKSVGVHPKGMTNRDYLQIMGPLINHGPNAAWRRTGYARVDEDKTLRDQVFDFDTDIRVQPKALQVGPSHVRVMSVKNFPGKAYFGSAVSYIGDVTEGIRGIRCPFILTANLFFPDRQRAKAKLSSKRQWINHQAYGPLLKAVPKLAARKHDFDSLFESLDDGDALCKLSLTLVLFAQTKDEATTAVSNAKAYWGELGYDLMPDAFICLPLFLNALPFGADRDAITETRRYRTMATRQAAVFLPLFSEWRGTGTPVLNLISRNGQLMSLSLYDSGTNYNTTIAAQSGSGKSFLTNEIINSVLSQGGRVWVIDVGRSYENLCELLDGQFIHFGKGKRPCLNPFELIRDLDEEEGDDNQEDVLIGLLAAMAAPSGGLTDLQIQWLKQALHASWSEKKQTMTVDDIAAWFEHEHERRGGEDGAIRLKDMADQLYSFTSNGQYGRFFNGKNNVQFDNRFTVLELEELKGRKHLQQVVLLQLIYQIQQEMYLGERDRPKVVIIDEAWDLLMQGDVAKFIEHGYRRFRKYGGAAVTITQGVGDLYAAPTGRAIVENSANMYLLGQKPEAIAALQRESRLPLTEAGYDLLRTVHTIPGSYSEIFVITGDHGAGIGRLIVPEFMQLIYSTKADEVNAIKRKRAQGMTVREACNDVLEERKRARVRAA